jgi:hypothetical protein
LACRSGGRGITVPPTLLSFKDSSLAEQLYTSDPDREVCCRICARSNVDYRTVAKKLVGHIGGKHSKDGWSKKKYLEEFEEGADDFSHPLPPEKLRVQNSNRFSEQNAVYNAQRRAKIEDGQALDMLLEKNVALLTNEEKEFYEQFVEEVFQQTDRDEVQRPQIASLAFDQIILARLRGKQLRRGTLDKDTAKAQEDAVKAAELRIRLTMESLGISREAQLKRGQSIKTTPASIISGYLDEIERMSPEQLDAFVREERRVEAKMVPRIAQYILKFAPDLDRYQEEEEGTGGDIPFTLEEALKRARQDVAAEPSESPDSDEDGFSL